jgi:hypothetical protein
MYQLLPNVCWLSGRRNENNMNNRPIETNMRAMVSVGKGILAADGWGPGHKKV